MLNLYSIKTMALTCLVKGEQAHRYKQFHCYGGIKLPPVVCKINPSSRDGLALIMRLFGGGG